jgi:hypothetical protein
MFNSSNSLISRITHNRKSEQSAKRRKELNDRIRERSENAYNFIKVDLDRYYKKFREEEEARKEKLIKNKTNMNEKAPKV